MMIFIILSKCLLTTENDLLFFLGNASVAKGLSNYIDALADKKVSDFLYNHLPMDVGFLAPYPDFFSFLFIMLITGSLELYIFGTSIYSYNSFQLFWHVE